MTDEEKAEENYLKVYLNGDVSLNTEEKYFAYTKGYRKGYTEGLAEGRKEKWHDLRKNPNDLPEESGEYWCKLKEKRRYAFEVYYTDSLFYKSRWEELDIIAWCELPKFKE